MVLKWYDNGVTIGIKMVLQSVLKWCYTGVAIGIAMYYNGITMVLKSVLQERVLELEAREIERQRATACPLVWVQLVDDPTKPSTATAFMVSPTVGNIDGLKKAVKAEVEANTGDRVNALTMKVYARIAEGVWEEVAEDAPLVANAKSSAYHVSVP